MAVDPAIRYVISFALAALFAASAAMKFVDLEMFESSVANYKIVPRFFERAAASAVPIAEVVVAFGLVFAPSRIYAAFGTLALLGIFTAAIEINLIRGRRDIDCGCFGPAIRQSLSGWLVARNLVLMLLAGVVIAAVSPRELIWIDVVTIAAGSAAILLVYASANLALANEPATRALEAI